MIDGDNELGTYLRAARGRMSPASAGIGSGVSGRRVTGLRREEVAVVAGVSADYYTRLEQGRERNPSAQVVDALAREVGSNFPEREHLFRLAGLSPRSTDAGRAVHPTLVEMLDAFPLSAAYVLGPALDVLAENAIATALLSPFGEERSMPRILFTDHGADAVFAEGATLRRATVQALRLNATRFPADPTISQLVSDLLDLSPEFSELWAEHGVGGLARAFKVFVHPVAGRIELTYQTFDAADAPGQQLLVGTPRPGSASEKALRSLSRD